MSRLFNGTTDKIVCDAANLWGDNAAFSLSFWVKSSSGSGVFCYSEGASGTTACMGLGSGTTSNLRFFLRTNVTVSTDLSGTATVFDGNWHHVGYTQPAGARTFKTYVDGVVDLSTAYASMGQSITRVGIGLLRRNSDSSFLAGSMGHVATWQRQLSAKEMLALSSGLPATWFDPLHYWPLFGADSPEFDIGKNAHVAGTLTGTSKSGGPRVSPDLLVVR